ncbi:hypothetical protein C8R46DRAFT_1207571 [Mycena filopes]|nr:hypothetical protein C8R46DRAFT_1207571 [Mycena filopes]
MASRYYVYGADETTTTFSALGLMPEGNHGQSYELSRSSLFGESDDVLPETSPDAIPQPTNKSPLPPRQLACVKLPDEDASETPPFAVSDNRLECEICMMDDKESLVVDPCGHAFCHECLTLQVQSKLKAGRYPITCPGCARSAEYSANSSVIRKDIVKRLGITDAQYQDFKQLERQHRAA